ncbi:hypothetical protein OWR29_43420 [Actinoplanes sp. Pm04-4]|uniref:Uncharacterized protein n=1 Tax=Paractinoplanes pyxinae TaxID=2997416 RepID=A0ABT4BEC2_9ACTN|nr:hypothetical protein [Actinoplanes pyxinae]MCY1144890.1 hypothetical protein [Actinoplanes pyxinae]
MGNLESVLTGVPYDVVLAQPRHGKAVTDVSGEVEHVVVAVTDTLRDALAAASHDTLYDAAVRLAATEELAGFEPAGIADFLHRLAALARRADGWHLYCYWSL